MNGMIAPVLGVLADNPRHSQLLIHSQLLNHLGGSANLYCRSLLQDVYGIYEVHFTH